jgi:hypothetical protein
MKNISAMFMKSKRSLFTPLFLFTFFFGSITLQAQYCASSASSTFDEEIFNVTLGTMSQSSTCATTGGPGSIQNRYSNYTTITTAPNLMQGQSYALSVQIGTCNGNYSNAVRVFIDYNQNNVFTDPGETVYTSSTYTNGPHTETGSVTIPLTATTGTTRMRVVNVETTSPTSISSCGTYTWGETEDYNVIIAAATPCTGSPSPGNTAASPAAPCPNAVVTLSLPNLPPATGYTYQWQSSPNNTTWTNIAAATNPTHTVTATTTTMYYRCIVTCSNTTLTGTSNSIAVTGTITAVCYCTTMPTSTADEEIMNVTMSNVNNSSTCASVAPGPGSVAMRYANYSSGPGAPAPIQLTVGYTTPFSVTVSSCGSYNYTSGLAIFIDLNMDGDYVDVGEKVYSNGPTANINCVPSTVVSGNLSIPPTALSGNTLMRIMNVEGTAGDNITPCMTYYYGETEDYAVAMSASPAIDMGATALIAPVATGCKSANQTVSVQIKNYTTTTINFLVTPVTVNASVAGPNPMTFTPVVINSGSLASNATMTVTITTTYNMTASGTFTFNASTSVTGDGNASNDAMLPVSILNSGGTAVANNNGLVCAGGTVDINLTNYTAGGTLQWQQSADNISWTNIIGATTTPYTALPSAVTYYRANVCSMHFSASDTATPITVAPATTTGTTRCGPGPTTVTGAGTGPLFWYANPTGGSPLGTGSSYTQYTVNTDTFYLENTFETCGPGGTPATPTCYPSFSIACSSGDYINSFSTTGGSTNISNMFSGCNGSGPTNTTFFPSQIVTVVAGNSFDIAIQSGPYAQGFRMWIDYNNDGDFADPGEDVWNSSTYSNAVMNGTIVVPANISPGPKRIRVMARYVTVPTATNYCGSGPSYGEAEEYTLNVCMRCTAPRTPAIATVTPAPVMAIHAVDSSLCDQETTQLYMTSVDPNYTYTWSPATYLNTTTGDTVTWSPTSPGIYQYVVDASDATNGCLNRDTISVMTSISPTVIASASSDTICSGTSTTLSSLVNTRTYVIDVANTANTSTSYPAPYGNYNYGAKHQILILASELQAAGMSAGPINGLNFTLNSVTTTPLLGFTIAMAHTTVPSLITFETTGFSTVYSSSVYVPTAGVNTHTFTTPFVWNGVDNIIIETCFNDGSYSYNCVFAQTSTAYTSTVWYSAYNATVCSSTSISGSAMQRPAITFFGQTNVLHYLWSPGATLSDPTINGPIATPPSSLQYMITVTDTVSGCTAGDTLPITVNPAPMPDFGPDTTICSNTPLLLNGTAGPYSYLWQDNSTGQTFSVSAFGTYFVEVTDNNNGCVGRDTITVGVNAAPAFSLGPDITVCGGSPVTFNGPSGAYTYDWNTSQTTQSITTALSGTYILDVTSTGNGCIGHDTVVLLNNPTPAVALGSDTGICTNNTPYTLNAPSGNYSYQWSNSSTNQSISISSSGTYYVTVTDNTSSCTDQDTITIVVNQAPVVALGGDTTFCDSNGPFTITAPSGPYTYLWSTNATTQSITVSTGGNYSVIVTDNANGCSSSDQINVFVGTTPVFTLNDTSVCATQYAIMGPAGSGLIYQWSTGATTSSIIVNSPGGFYSLTVTDAFSGCAYSDGGNVVVTAPPAVSFQLAVTGCTSDAPYTLTGTPAGGTFSGPGITGNTFNPAAAGSGASTITYTYTDANGCTGSVSHTITQSACVGVEEQVIAEGVHVFPNPNNGLFTLTIKNADIAELRIEVVTIDGKTVYTDEVSGITGDFSRSIDLGAEANGIYFLRLTIDGQTVMQKVIKQE